MPDSAPLPRLTLPVEGMSCASCVGRVERALAAVPGVAEARVNLAAESVTVSGAAPVAALAEALSRAGYALPMREVRLAIGGMSCASCVGRVERALLAVPGVLSARVNLADESALVTLARDVPDGTLLAAATRAGYSARAAETAPAEGETRARLELAAALLLAAPFLVGMLGMALGRDWMPPGWAQLALAAPLQLWLGARFWRAGLAAARAGAANMDLLVAIGTTAASK
jgi:P-type Cu+ transporter